MDKLPFPFVYDASADSPAPPAPEWIETLWLRAEFKADRSGGAVVPVLDEVPKVRGWSESLKSKRDAARHTGNSCSCQRSEDWSSFRRDQHGSCETLD
jgi:hypothetical protein